jgi:cephalosporin-C deacetylase
MRELYEYQTSCLDGYKGIGAAPADFSEYWARALKELDSASLEYRLIKSNFISNSCDAFDLYFTGVGGANVHCQLLKPKNIPAGTKLPAIALFHEYWKNYGDWTGKLGYIAEGFCVLAMDVRGQDDKSEDNNSYKCNTQRGHMIRGVESAKADGLFYRSVYLDAAQCARILMSMDFVDAKNVFATGALQGGALTVACACLIPQLKAAAPMHPFLCDFRGIYQNNFNCECYEEITWYFRQCDSMQLKEDVFFERLGYIDLKNLTKLIQCDILWFTALTDHVCPVSSQMAAYNAISSNKDIIYFPQYQHEFLPYAGNVILSFFEKQLTCA